MELMFANSSVSVTELKQSPNAVIEKACGAPVAILHHNRPKAYLVPAATFAAMMERLDDLDLADLVRERAHEPTLLVSMDDL